MTFSDFITKYVGTICTHPKGINGQCVCLYRCYLDQVLGVPQSPPVIGAKDIWKFYNPTYFTRIPNTPLAIPKKGDIMIWPAFTGNPSGHVGMVVDATIWSFKSFDSNWSIPKRANIEKHNYLSPRVLGWLRKK